MLRRLSLFWSVLAPAMLLSQAQGKPKPSPLPSLADVSAKAPAVAGLPSHRISLTESRKIVGSTIGLGNIVEMNTGPRGQVALVFNRTVNGFASGPSVLALFDSTGRRLWTVNSGRDAEIGWFGAFGWRATDFWVYDPQFSQIALIDHGTVTKSLEMPSWIRPGWNERKNYPIFGRFDVRALLDDGSMVGYPSRPHSLGAGAAFDSTKQVILHVTADGVIDRTIASIPDRQAEWQRQYSDFRRSQTAGAFPPKSSTLNTREWPTAYVSWDGKHVAVVSSDSSQGMVDSITVSMFDGNGRPIYLRRFAHPRKSWNPAQIDSLAKARYPRLDPTTRAERAATMIRVIKDVERVQLGGDGSIWLTMRANEATWPVVGIDPNGQVIGTLYLPFRYTLRGADAGGVWLVDGRTVIKDLVRYTYR